MALASTLNRLPWRQALNLASMLASCFCSVEPLSISGMGFSRLGEKKEPACTTTLQSRRRCHHGRLTVQGGKTADRNYRSRLQGGVLMCTRARHGSTSAQIGLAGRLGTITSTNNGRVQQVRPHITQMPQARLGYPLGKPLGNTAWPNLKKGGGAARTAQPGNDGLCQIGLVFGFGLIAHKAYLSTILGNPTSARLG